MYMKYIHPEDTPQFPSAYMSLEHLRDESVVIVVLATVPVAKRGFEPTLGCRHSTTVCSQVPLAWDKKRIS